MYILCVCLYTYICYSYSTYLPVLCAPNHVAPAAYGCSGKLVAMSRVVSWKMQHVLTNVHTYVCAYVPGRVCDAIRKTRPRATGHKGCNVALYKIRLYAVEYGKTCEL